MPISHSRTSGTSSRRYPLDPYLSHPRPAHQCRRWTQASKSDLCSETEEVARLRRGCECHASLLRSAGPRIKQSKASEEIRAILRPLSRRGSFSLILPILLSLVKIMLFSKLFLNVFSKKSCRLVWRSRSCFQETRWLSWRFRIVGGREWLDHC